MRPATPDRGQTILVVDDDIDTRALLRMALEEQGFAVESAGDGLSALQKIGRQPPDAVVLDLNMPRMGGEDFLYAWRAGGELADVPVVVITATAKTLRPQDLGVQGIFPKPFDMHKLVACVASLVAAPTRPPVAARRDARVAELRDIAEGLAQVMGAMGRSIEALASAPSDSDELRSIAAAATGDADRGASLVRRLHRVVSTLD